MDTLSPIPFGVVVVYTIVSKFDCGESICVVVVVVQFNAILLLLLLLCNFNMARNNFRYKSVLGVCSF